MKQRSSRLIPSIAIVLLMLILNPSANAQLYFGIQKINVFADFAFASPKQALVNPGGYGLGNAMQLYYGAEIPFAHLKYGKKSSMHLSVAAIVDHEKANFSTSNYQTDGMDAKLTAFGIRARPFSGMGMFNVKESDYNDGKDYTTTEKHVSQEGESIQLKNGERVTATEWTETRTHHGWSTAESKGIIYMLLSGLYFDYGISKASLIEPPTPTIDRSPKYWGWGFAPSLVPGKKTSFYLDFGWRTYSWTNNLNTTSSIKSFRCGFGLGFALNTAHK